MKNFIFAVMALVALTSLCFADDFGDHVAQAQKLKAKGKYAEAAKVHPRVLCQAEYLWNAACQLIGKRDKNNNWRYSDAKATEESKAQALAYLDEAEADIKQTTDGTDLITGDDGTCKGVDADDLLQRIGLVRACIQGNCK